MPTANLAKLEANKKKVLEAKLKDPTKSHRKIAEEIGMSPTSVRRNFKYLAQDGTLKDSSIIHAIRDADLQIVEEGQKLILEKIRSGRGLEIRDLSATAKDSQIRYSFLTGENAKTDGGEKRILEGLSEEELKKLAGI